MSRAARYETADQIVQGCKMLRLSQDRVSRRAGSPPDFCDQPNAAVTAEKYFEVFAAVEAEANRLGIVTGTGVRAWAVRRAVVRLLKF